jgi:Domain of unknown function (DU1801)
VSEFLDAIRPYTPEVRARLKELRLLVLKTAAETKGVGRIEETLKWGQPSFLTPDTGSGCTIRIDGRRGEPERLAMYVHCQSGLIEEFRELYPRVFEFEGKRAMVFDVAETLPTAELKHCISLALTHHLRKKKVKLKYT